MVGKSSFTAQKKKMLLRGRPREQEKLLRSKTDSDFENERKDCGVGERRKEEGKNNLDFVCNWKGGGVERP